MTTTLRKKLGDIRGSRSGVTLYRDGDTGLRPDKYDDALKTIVEMVSGALERGEKRCAGRCTLMDQFRQHPEWAELTAYGVYSRVTENMQKIKHVMASDEFREWKESLKEGVNNGRPVL